MTRIYYIIMFIFIVHYSYNNASFHLYHCSSSERQSWTTSSRSQGGPSCDLTVRLETTAGERQREEHKATVVLSMGGGGLRAPGAKILLSFLQASWQKKVQKQDLKENL